MLLSTQGVVFSFGKAADLGQLGHGDRCERSSPSVIDYLKNCGERIQAVACGHAHCLAKTALGKVYAWGWNALGQLGIGSLTESEATPKLMAAFKETASAKDGVKKKALSIAAGYSHSMTLTEGRIPYYSGTCGAIEKQAVSIRLPIEKLYTELFPKGIQATAILPFSVGKIGIAWSKSLSITYATMLDMRGLTSSTISKADGKGTGSISQQLNNLTIKWNIKDMDPPYVESLASVFSTAVMRKQTVVIKKKPAKSTQESTNLLKAALKKGLAYEAIPMEKSLKTKVQEVDQWIQHLLDKEQEARTEQENSIISSIINKVFK